LTKKEQEKLIAKEKCFCGFTNQELFVTFNNILEGIINTDSTEVSFWTALGESKAMEMGVACGIGSVGLERLMKSIRKDAINKHWDIAKATLKNFMNTTNKQLKKCSFGKRHRKPKDIKALKSEERKRRLEAIQKRFLEERGLL
jgi:hypothetical protein